MKRLHVVFVIAANETKEQRESIFSPTLVNGVFECIMQREMINNDSHFLVAITNQ